MSYIRHTEEKAVTLTMRLHSKGRVRQVTKSALTMRLHSKGRVRQVTKSALTVRLHSKGRVRPSLH